MFIQEKLQAWRAASNLTGPCPMSEWLDVEQKKLERLDPTSRQYAVEEDKIRQELLNHPDWNTQLSWQGFRMVEPYAEPRRGLAQFTFLTHVLTAPYPTLGRGLKGFLQRDLENDIVTDRKVLKLIEDYLAIEILLPGDIRYEPNKRFKSSLPKERRPERKFP